MYRDIGLWSYLALGLSSIIPFLQIILLHGIGGLVALIGMAFDTNEPDNHIIINNVTYGVLLTLATYNYLSTNKKFLIVLDYFVMISGLYALLIFNIDPIVEHYPWTILLPSIIISTYLTIMGIIKDKKINRRKEMANA